MYNYKYYAFLICNRGKILYIYQEETISRINLKERQKYDENYWYLKYVGKEERKNKNVREIILNRHHNSVVVQIDNTSSMIYILNRFRIVYQASFGYRQEFLDLFYKKT